MFKKATSRQLLSVSSLFILVWHTALGQELWKGYSYLPDPLPIRKIEKNKDTGVLGKQDGQVFVFDMRSQKLRSPDLRPGMKPSFSSAQSQSWPDSFRSFSPPSEKVFSSLQKVNDSSSAPWRMQVKLFVTAANGKRFSCSGTLIDAAHVVTASHCIFSRQKGGWATNVEVVPAYDAGQAIYGSALMEEALVWENWVDHQNYKDDLAIVRLDRPIGAITGWLSFGYQLDDSFFRRESFHNPGYPASGPYDGQHLYSWRGSFDYFYGKELLYHKNQAYAGQSGSTSFVWKEGKSPVLFSVLSHGVAGSTPFTGHVRLTAKKFAEIQEYINQSRRPELDLMPLYVKTRKDAYHAGESFDDLSFVLYNLSKQSFREDLKLAVELFDEAGNAYELGQKKLESISLEKGKSQTIHLEGLNWSWPQNLGSGTYALAVRLLLEDDQVENNLSAASDRTLIRLEKKENPAFLELSTSEFTMAAEGDVQWLRLTTSADQDWKIIQLVDWLDVAPAQGRGSRDVKITVVPYSGTARQTTSLLVIAGDIEKEVLVVQESLLHTDEIVLTPGWNLISLDVIPENTRVEAVFAGLKPGNLLQVNGIENGKYQYFRPGNAPEANTLKEFIAGAGYWVQVKTEDVLIVRGQAIAENFKRSLHPGRNLIAYIPQFPQLVSTYFEDLIEEGRLKYVVEYENGKSYRFSPSNPEGSSLKEMSNGKGYWVELEPAQSALQTLVSAELEPMRPLPVPLRNMNSPIHYDIQHLAFDHTFLINIKNQQKGTLLLMISDINGRVLKKKQWTFGQEEQVSFPLTYGPIFSRQLILTLFFNQQHLNSRVYLND